MVNFTLPEKPDSSYALAKYEKDPWKSGILGKSTGQPPVSFFKKMSLILRSISYILVMRIDNLVSPCVEHCSQMVFYFCYFCYNYYCYYYY